MATDVVKQAEDLVAGYLAQSPEFAGFLTGSGISGGILSKRADVRGARTEPPRVEVMGGEPEFQHRFLAKVPVAVRLVLAIAEDGEEDLSTPAGTAATWLEAMKWDLRDLSAWDTFLRTLDPAQWGCRYVTPVGQSSEMEVDGTLLQGHLTTGVMLTMLAGETGAPAGDPLPGTTVVATRTKVGIFTAGASLGSGRFVTFDSDGEVIAANASAGLEASGYIIEAVTAGDQVTVYDGGVLNGLSGLTPGLVQLLGNGGLRTQTAPTTAGHVVQRLGRAVSATAMVVDMEPGIVLA